tara:strand:- start:392 stop:892 length:501 start_codon:yes stop_codon:yes gene_type:complete
VKVYRYILQDWEINKGSVVARILLVQFRLLQLLLQLGRCGKMMAILPWVLYKLYSEFFLHIELSPKTQVGASIHFPHPFSIVINANSKVGKECVIRHGVTIGNKGDRSLDSSLCPYLHDGVNVGCNAVVIGGVTLGSGSTIGAGSVVICNVEEGAFYAGVPARKIK